MFEEVSLKVSKPSNSFVLFNHWDTAEKSEDVTKVRAVKKEHCEKVKEILVERLKVMDEDTAEKRTFFVSAREAFENCNPQQKSLGECFVHELGLPLYVCVCVQALLALAYAHVWCMHRYKPCTYMYCCFICYCTEFKVDSHSETAQKRRQREFENFESMLHVSSLSPCIACVCAGACTCVCGLMHVYSVCREGRRGEMNRDRK